MFAAYVALTSTFAATSCDAIPGPSVTEQCLPFPSSQQAPLFSTPVSGRVEGASVRAVSCPGGVSAWIEPDDSIGTDRFLFFLIGSPGEGNARNPPDFVFQYPLGAKGSPLATLGLASAIPGEYSSPAGGQCGSVSFTYETPLSLTVDCDAGTPPKCPSGCTALCGMGCTPCEPEATLTTYRAVGSSADCVSNTRTPLGSWRLSLTSVVPKDGGADAGHANFMVHGSLNATLIGPGGDGDTAELSLAF
jgi:hypothetical protein